MQPFSEQSTRVRRAQEAWARTPIPNRLDHVTAFRHSLSDCKLAIAETIEADIGKPQRDSLIGELLPLGEACLFLEWFAEEILDPKWSPLRYRPYLLWGQRDEVYRQPRGLVGIIGTWNFPFLLSGVQAIHALVAGNGVLLKPSELAPRSGQLLHELLLKAGFPADLISLLPATREAGPQLAETDIDHVVFTGHSNTGRRLAARLGERLVTSTLELSGCDALYVLDDADVVLAARGAWFGATINNGQACIGTRRAFVPRHLLEPFLGTLLPLVANAQPVKMVMPQQVELAARVVADAEAAGAKIIRVAGDVTAGMVQPAALVGIQGDALLCREAVFAPLLGVIVYDQLEEAFVASAKCPYALGASVFTRNPAQVREWLGKIRAGVVCINDVIAPTGHPATPFGGTGASGWGVTQGVEGLLEMTVPQVVSYVSGSSRPHFDWHGTYWLIRRSTAEALLDWRHARSWSACLRGGWRVLLRSLGLAGPDEPAKAPRRLT
jgi:acyl-CoA reductase-like NAD-dependent aldehyde dehydrogenase